jgi:hypothetical protein
MNQARVAVLIPCLNETVTIGKVVADFRSNLEDAVIYVYSPNYEPMQTACGSCERSSPWSSRSGHCNFMRAAAWC